MAEVAEASEMEALEDSPPAPEKEIGETGVRVLTEQVESETPVIEAVENVAAKEKAEKTSFELAENVNSTEDTEDESDDEEMETFLRLMNKAEKKKMVTPGPMQTIHLGAGSRANWRGSNMGGAENSDSDTSDEDDTEETRRFLSLMGGREKKASSGMVNIRWEDGRVVGLPPNIKVTRVPQSEETRRRQEEDLIRRRRQHLEAIRREGPVATTCSGKRKFEERMTLSEAKADDFTDTKDYVDFIQAKLKNVNIKIIK